jgi:hypothetical protein
MKEVSCGEIGCGCSGGSRLAGNGTLRPVDSRMEPRLFSRVASHEIDPRGFAIGPYHQPPAFDPRKLLMGPIETRSIEDTVRRGYPGLKGVDPSHLIVGGQRKTPFVVTATGRLEVPMQSDQGLVLASMILTLALQGPNPQELELVGLEGFGSLRLMSCTKETCKGALSLRLDKRLRSDLYTPWGYGDRRELDVFARLIWATCQCEGPESLLSQPVRMRLQLEIGDLEHPVQRDKGRPTGVLAAIQLTLLEEPARMYPSKGADGDTPIPSAPIRNINHLGDPARRIRFLGGVENVLLRGTLGYGHIWRQTRLQPIFLTDSLNAPAYQPDIPLFQTAIANARQVWAKAGVDFYILPPLTIDLSDRMLDLPGLPNRANVDYSRNVQTGTPDGAYEHFLLKEGEFRIIFFRTIEGRAIYGYTEPRSGSATAYIVTSMANRDLDGIHKYHLAHELGHLLGMLHVGERPNPLAVTGSTGTVMCQVDVERPVEVNAARARNSLWHKVNVVNSAFILRVGGSPPPPPDCCHGAHDMDVCQAGGCAELDCERPFLPPCANRCPRPDGL